MTDRTLCVLCRSEASHDLLEGLLLRCDGRGLVLVLVQTTSEPEVPEVLYESDYFTGDGYEDYYQPSARRFEGRRRLRWLRRPGRIGSLLDVGAAGGYFVETARRAGVDASGVEISPAACQNAREVLGMPVVTCALEDFETDRTYDVVCAFHVLEHLHDPGAFVRDAVRLLRPGVRLALEVPNITAAAFDRLGSSWPKIDAQHHLWHFSPDTMSRLLAAERLEIVALDTVFSRFYWQSPARHLPARSLLIADIAASGSLRVSHPDRGDLLRVAARRPVEGVTG